MELFFYIVPTLMIGIAVFAVTRILGRSRQISSAWSSGLTAEARCLRSYTTTSGGGDSSVRTTLHHVYEFSTRDGRTVRFEEGNGPATIVEGDIVTVHYAAQNPEKATAHAPSPVRAAVGTVVIVAFLGVIVAFCIGFMITFHEMSASGDAFFGGI